MKPTSLPPRLGLLVGRTLPPLLVIAMCLGLGDAVPVPAAGPTAGSGGRIDEPTPRPTPGTGTFRTGVAEPAPRTGALRTGVADLAERLKAGLRVERPADVAFCDAVARHVAEGRLPRQVVDGTYAWSLARGRKYPFPAFAQALRIKAARLGVSL